MGALAHENLERIIDLGCLTRHDTRSSLYCHAWETFEVDGMKFLHLAFHYLCADGVEMNDGLHRHGRRKL